MILFIGEGGLGNQIYQYAFIKNFLKKDELLVTFNFKKFNELFDHDDRILDIDNKYVYFIARVIFRRVFELLSCIKLISSVRANRVIVNNYSVEGDSYKFYPGLLPVTYVYPGFFQSEKFFDKRKLLSLTVKEEYIKKAKKIIDNVPEKFEPYFVHIRRGDYSNEVALGVKDITLPKEYYRKSMIELKNQVNNVFYIFMSNDVDFVETEFDSTKNKVISKESDLVDFALMTLCKGGIVSNSSFSWWGAYFGKRENILAPKYWYGFKSNVEIPISVMPSFAKIVDFKKYD